MRVKTFPIIWNRETEREREKEREIKREREREREKKDNIEEMPIIIALSVDFGMECHKK